MSQQLIFDWQRELVPSLDNFIIGSNAELHAVLRASAAGECSESVYLWGAPGSGKTHLLRGFSAAAGALYFDCRGATALEDSSRLAVDHIDADARHATPQPEADDALHRLDHQRIAIV